MPRIKRWFPVSHDINSDPEMWDLRERFGERAGFVWLEMLSIADRNEGITGPNSGSTRAAIAAKCRTSRAKVESVFGYAETLGWIKLDTHVRVLNFSKYHRTWEHQKIPEGKLNSSPPNQTEPDLPDPNPPIVPQKGDERGFESFWKEYPKKVGKGAALKAWGRIRPSNGTREGILAAVRTQKTWEQWTKDNGQYIPNPATWLNQKRWEDEGMRAGETSQEQGRRIAKEMGLEK